MIELLRRVAEADADRPAIVTDHEAQTYGALAARAEAVGAGLRARDIARFATITDDPAAIVTVLAASSLTGSEACQYAPTDEPTDVRELADRFDHEVFLTDRPALAGLDGARTVEELAVDTGPAAPAEPPAERPLLVLTTGTTGVPRGVRHDWARVLRAAARVQPAPGQRWLLAYGLHQFAGLQILTHVLSAGATLVAPEGRRPQQGLTAIRAHDVHHVSATPTWWRFLLAELRAEGGAAPDLEQITLGGEAAPAPLLEQLASTFPKARLSHVYAASEFGSTGSVRDGQSGLDLTVLDRGDDADVAMKVVDGELWVRSRIGMLGYYGEAPVDADSWRPTGDLVEVVGDRIQFRGRASEVINVGGVKVHPLPVEDLVSSVPEVQIARVFGRPNNLTGAIVAVEVVATPGADVDEVAAAIRTACAELPAAARPRSIKFVEDLTTLGGKVIRREPGGS